MKAGDYCRTKSGWICKLDYYDEKEKRWITHDENDWYPVYETQIKISSPNIIDLIEVGDVIKIEEQKGIYTICEVERFKDPYTNYKFLGVRLDNSSIVRRIYELNINSIVTKEQFESMEYRL